MKDRMDILRNIILVGQLGLSLIMPVLLCLALCYLLVTKLNAGICVYFAGFFFGLGASFMTAYKVYLSVTGSSRKEDEEDSGFSMNRHM